MVKCEYMYPDQPSAPQPQPTPPASGGNGGIPPLQPQSSMAYQAQSQPAAQPQIQQPPYGAPQSPYVQPQVTGAYPTQPGGFSQQDQTAQPTYAVDYLEQIAPPPPRKAFLSGGFGKIIVLLAVIFIFAVGLIVALGNQKKTADLERVTTRIENLRSLAKDAHVNLKNQTLRASNSTLQNWLGSASFEGYDLLAKAEVKKNRIDKKMIAAEKAATDKLKAKFDDAKLNANLDETYANEMAYQMQIILIDLQKMSKQSQAKAIRDFAKKSIDGLTPIQKKFATYENDLTIGN